ncbi:hypothetical protein LQG66_13205 [Bradyrhizobium ontarionense]|uniref:Uncharacterized protein n=1 Tax=Bradyrhizobium ontarionense TaxID=2898149 RepID=A0ABY3RJZ1_9BRAD|nr:hypothetical protein [Bradyrhizobium sp. A19]UFZ07197.1 hypothetical protein LQG66_13205 [Bradyrhizobium sp. A19]
MSISSVSTPVAATSSQATTATQSTSSTSQTSSSSAASSAGSTSESASGGGGSSSSKTVVSEVSITLDGITTTTITYSDGSSEVTKTAAHSDDSSKGAQTYNAQGATNTAATVSASASSQGVKA